MGLQPLDLLQSPSETKQKYHQAPQISSYPSFRASEVPQSDQSHKNERKSHSHLQTDRRQRLVGVHQ